MSDRSGYLLVMSIGLVLLAPGCSSYEAEPEEEHDGPVASLNLSLVADEALAGKSISVSGARSAVDSKYPCVSHVENVCFNFPGVWDTAAATAPNRSIENLCPSADLAAPSATPTSSTWNFTFSIHDGSDCGGAALTDIVCYDRSSLGVPMTENQVRDEVLTPGLNTNSIICVTNEAAPAVVP